MIKFLQTPTKAKKVVLGGLLTIVAVMMVITLIPGIYDGMINATPKGVYARVGGRDITTVEVNRAAQQMARQQRVQPEAFAAFEQFFRTQAATQLISNYALIAEAQRLGLQATDDEVRDFLHQGQFGEQLFPGGQFVGQQNYEGFVQQNFNMSVAEFETLVKNQILRNKLLAMVLGTVTVPESDVRDDYFKQNRKVKFDYAVLTTPDLMKQVKVTDTELKAYFDKHKQDYVNSIPEKRKARYIVINAATIPGVKVTDDDLKQYYNQHAGEYNIPERVHVRHILVKTPPGADQKTVDLAKAKAEDLLKQIQGGSSLMQRPFRE